MKMFVFASVILLLGVVDGVPNSGRIHGGVEAPLSRAAHMAALVSTTPWLRVFCGASIVSRRHLLTAAHCLTQVMVEGQLPPSVFGRVASNIWHSGGETVNFLNSHIHPFWDEDLIKYDVAILVLTKDLELGEAVTVIGLDFGWVGGDELSFVTGWGTTWPKITETSVHLAPTPDELQLLYVRTLTPAQCEEGIQSNAEWAQQAPPLDHAVEICAFHSIRHGVCHGDSGGALVSLSTGLQSGIVSWGMPCAQGAPDFYTRLRGVEDFIRPILTGAPGFSS